ncbi:hypothetical protein EZV62_004811 [Acer yangbiense]|uniref:Ubiquitin-like protease family profile domain-containing protein n=1 Tax=Acer yangbiense TaxID=1000413 RepID=A0A5C7IN44_9ROSI|nr:hypothetical protein EZV62_004811 [Acer yangbiense]
MNLGLVAAQGCISVIESRTGRLKMVKKVILEKKKGGSDQITSMNKLSKPKIGRMAWINYFALECKKRDDNGNSKSRSEIGKTWNSLPYEEKAKFREPDVVQVIATNMPAEQPQHRDNDIPNNHDFPPMDEEIRGTRNHLGHEDQTINTRCTPFQWCRIVKKLSEEQKQVVRALGFGNLLALNCGRLRLKICRWLVDNFDTKACAIDIHGRRFAINSYFAITSRGIFLKDIEHSLEEMTTADDEFKVTLCLFLLGTILYPSAIDYVQTGYLIPLGDVGSIDVCCFLSLHSLQWDHPMVDKSLLPIVCWTNVKIRKCVTRLHIEGGLGTNQILVDDVFEQPAPAERQYDGVAHGETSHANQQPGSINNVHIKVRTVPSLVDEDTLNDDNHELESLSSNKRRIIQTRLTSKRKPSRFQISPYIAGPVHASTKYRYGLFRIGIQLNIYDEQLIIYIFDKKLPSSEVIVDIGNLRVTRKSFRTLEPTKFLDSEIINLIPEYKTIMFKSRSSQLSWFLPTTYAYIVFTCAEEQQYTLQKSLSKLRESYMSDLRRCQKIYIPINDLCNHWYLAVIDLINRDCQIWDSIPPRRKEDLTRLNQVRKLMQSLDIVLADDITVAFPTSFSFTDFSILYAEAPNQPNGYDCGLFICMFMDDNCPAPIQMKSARFLALFPGNTNLLTLKKNSQEHYNKSVSNNEVVPRLNMRPPPMKKLKSKAANLME